MVNSTFEVSNSGAPSSLTLGTYNYQYDYRTRRVLRDESAAGGNVTTVVFSGGTSVQEIENGQITVQYVRGSDYGGGIGGIWYTLRSGVPSFTHYNSRGDVVAKTNNAATVTYQALYEAYGKRTVETGNTLDRQKANTKDEDPTGLLNEGWRYRNLDTGSFITRDPAGFIDGPNVYSYVVDNPWTHFDPEGLAKVKDYQQDETKATTWHNQATRDAGGDKIKQKAADDTYKKWTDADQKGISNIEATAKKWNDAAKKEVAKASELDDSSRSFKMLANDNPKTLLFFAGSRLANIISEMVQHPESATTLSEASQKAGVSPNLVLSVLAMEGRGLIDFGGDPAMIAKEVASYIQKGGNMSLVSVGPGQLKGPARAAAGLSVDQAKSLPGAIKGTANWLSSNPGGNPDIKSNYTDQQRSSVYNGGANSLGGSKQSQNGGQAYGVEEQTVQENLFH